MVVYKSFQPMASRKIFSIIIYSLVLFLLTATSIASEAIFRQVGLLGEYKNVIDLPTFIAFVVSLLVIGFPLFLFANKILNKFDGINPYRSLLYVLVLLSCFSIWALNGFNNQEEDGYHLLWMGISIIAILVHYYDYKQTSSE